MSSSRYRPSSRELAIAGLSVLVILISLRACLVVPPPGALGPAGRGPSIDDRSEHSQSEHVLSDRASGPDAARFASIDVRWCQDREEDVQLLVFNGEEQGLTAPSGQLSCHETEADRCTFSKLPAGFYRIWQGPFVASTQIGANTGWKDGSVDLGCTSACGGSMSITSPSGCATQGQFSVSSPLPPDFQAPLLEASWQADTPVVLSGLPCLAEATLRVWGGDCAPIIQSIDLNRPSAQWRFELEPVLEAELHLIDLETRDSIPFLKLRLMQHPSPTQVDEDGRLSLKIAQPSDGQHRTLGRVTGEGYAPRNLRTSDLTSGESLITVEMLPTKPTEIVCEHGGMPCELDTRISIIGRPRLSLPRRHCHRLERGTWICPAGQGDRVQIRQGPQRLEVDIPEPGVPLPVSIGPSGSSGSSAPGPTPRTPGPAPSDAAGAPGG